MAKKKKDSRTKRERGRPQRLDDSALEQVEQLSLAGLSLREMGAILGASRKSIETLLAAHPDFGAKIQTLRTSPLAMAKLLIVEELKRGDVATAKWLIERESRLACERERAALLRQQRRVLERAENPEQAPVGLMSDYWQKVDKYFHSQYENKPKPESTEAGEASDKGDTAEAADPGDNNNGDKTDK